MQVLRADCVFNGWMFVRHGDLLLDDEGRFMGFPSEEERAESVYYPGLICPGFVNAHCHLELSYLAGKIPQRTGMVGFITTLQRIRGNFSDAEVEAAATRAAAAMLAKGILAVGDICNGDLAWAAKQAHSQMHFHNFVEVFGLNPSQAEEIFHRALALAERMGPHASITLHAPYSISKPLRTLVQDYAAIREWPQSIHLLESEPERELFAALSGPLMDFLRQIGAPFSGHTYPSPIDYVLEGHPTTPNTLLVHNTEMEQAEIDRIARDFPHAYFVLCPLANQYINGKLPPAPLFRPHYKRVCIGTDSLASNTDLDMLAELRALQQAYKLPADMLFQWATHNGAAALGLPPGRFSFELGVRPTLLHLPEFSMSNLLIPNTYEIEVIQV